MKKLFRFLTGMLVCWALLIGIEAARLVGSENPACAPLLVIGSTQRADVCAYYQSLGFSVEYALVYPDAFAGGTFRILGVPVVRW